MDAYRIVLANRPQGAPKEEDFRLERFEPPALNAGEVLVRTIWLSLDPYMRGRMDAAKSYATPVELNETMQGGGVAEVVESNDKAFPVGCIVTGAVGWASHAVMNGTGLRRVDPELAPISTALGILGMPGHTAWVGLNDIARAAPGETIVVSAATGAVGSVVGQLARRAGLKVIGVAGGADKCSYAEQHLGYDICLDHKAFENGDDLGVAIKNAAPSGVDIYYENVAGKTLEAVIGNMNTNGRIAVCGMISWYSGRGIAEAMALPVVWRAILTRRLRVEGFIIFDHQDRFQPFIDEVGPLVNGGELFYHETIAEGLAAAPRAFMGLLQGDNLGKQLVRVGPDTCPK